MEKERRKGGERERRIDHIRIKKRKTKGKEETKKE